MIMKTRLLATCALLALSSVALADRGHAPHAGRFDIDQLEILLDLDAYQKAEVQKILDVQREARKAKRDELREAKTRPSFEEIQKEREAARAATRTQLQKLLSEQQLKKFDVLTSPPQRREGADR
jgi:hypothetical protein